jgi:hypothetical protein
MIAGQASDLAKRKEHIMYHDAQGNENEDLEMDNMRRNEQESLITLQQIEEGVNRRILQDTQTRDYADLLRCYEVLAQVKQAQAAEKVANILSLWNSHGLLGVREQ